MTIRSNGKRTEIRNMPYEGNGRGYAILDDMIDASRRGQVKYEGRGLWTVARTHTNAVILGLAAHYRRRVKVIQYGGVEKCVEACCVRAGRNHGSGVPYKLTVDSNGPGGSLSVQAGEPHEFYVYP